MTRPSLKTSNRRRRLTIRPDVSVEQLRHKAETSSRRIARRFHALAGVLEGESYPAVAKQYDVSLATIYYWIHCLNSRGLQDLQHPPQQGRKCRLRRRDGVTIQKLLSAANTADAEDSKRLLAISKLLAESPCHKVAREAEVGPAILSAWIKRFNERGIPGLLAKRGDTPRARVVLRDDIPLADIHAAAQRASSRMARRLEAVLLVLSGVNCREAGDRLGVSKSAVGKWCQRFNDDGIEGLIDKCEARARTS